MDADSDNDAGFEVGRQRTSPSSSRDSSPVAKRPRRSFTPTSDDGHLAVPVAHTKSPNPESAPLIRQALGFASVGTSVSTYQATAAALPYFLPGQAPPPPPPQAKQKPSKPRAPRKKKGEQFSSHISKFKLSGSVSSLDSGFASGSTASTRNSADASPSHGAAAQLAAPTIPVSSYLSGYADDRATASSRNVAALDDDSCHHGVKRARKSTKKNVPPDVRSSAGSPASSALFTFNADPERPSTSYSRTCSATPSPDSSRARSLATPVSQNVEWSLRLITLLIEDTRSGVTDLQLAEVTVPLKITNDPEDGFWADAVDVSEALQSGPSRIDGPAKVYTLRGKFRQFFMRVDQHGQLQVQSAHLGVSRNRTMNAFVEAPGQLPRPPVPPSDGRSGYGPSSETTYHRPAYSLVTREDRIERLSKSMYVLPQAGRYAPESGGYRRSQRSTSPHRASIPGRHADTQEERDDAIVNYIRRHVEDHPGWMDYMQSKAKPQRVSEMLKQYAFVEDRVRELIGIETPVHCDGALNCRVDRHHVWRVLKLDAERGEECRETLFLVGFYGKKGSRYEDSRVVDMINDTSFPRPDTTERFLRLLRNVDESFTQDALRGPELP